MNERRTIHYSGHVQGVGFRYTVEQIARALPVQGYVRNLADGRVQLVMEAEAPVLDKVAAEVDDRMQGFVRDRQIETSPATGEFKGFGVR